MNVPFTSRAGKAGAAALLALAAHCNQESAKE